MVPGDRQEMRPLHPSGGTAKAVLVTVECWTCQLACVACCSGNRGVVWEPAVPTLISTHQGLLACEPMPNSAPLAFLNIQLPR